MRISVSLPVALLVVAAAVLVAAGTLAFVYRYDYVHDRAIIVGFDNWTGTGVRCDPEVPPSGYGLPVPSDHLFGEPVPIPIPPVYVCK